jgi:small subunit ribosomal protein S18
MTEENQTAMEPTAPTPVAAPPAPPAEGAVPRPVGTGPAPMGQGPMGPGPGGPGPFEGAAPRPPFAPSGPGGPGGGPRPTGPRRGPRGRYPPRRRVCQFCVDKVQHIDFKDVSRLRRYLSDRAKIEPRRKTGTCAHHQRALSEALKRARFMALLPYTADHIRLSGIVLRG